MKIEVTEQAEAKLHKYVAAKKLILLDLDDGFGRYSGQGDCSLITKFRIIAVDSGADISDYTVHLDSSLGTIYFKDSAKDFLDENMSLKVNPKTQLLVFANKNEIIDKSVNIIDYDEVKSK